MLFPLTRSLFLPTLLPPLAHSSHPPPIPSLRSSALCCPNLLHFSVSNRPLFSQEVKLPEGGALGPLCTLHGL